MQSAIEPEVARRATLDSLPIGVVVVDDQFRVHVWNHCLEQWSSISAKSIVGHDIRDRFPHLRKARYAERLRPLFTGGPPVVFSSQLHPHLIPAPQPSGRMRVFNTSAVAVPSFARPGAFDALLAIQDVSNLADAMTALRQSRSDAEHLAASDPLTGLGNRRHFFAIADKVIAHARRHSLPCGLMMLDIDGFKGVNDRHGHAGGDLVLRTLVRVFEATLRKSDHVARLGGDEFAVLLPECRKEIAANTAERLRTAVNHEELDLSDETIRVGVSIGVTELEEGDVDVDAFLRRADTALYEAKRKGRNRVVVR